MWIELAIAVGAFIGYQALIFWVFFHDEGEEEYAARRLRRGGIKPYSNWIPPDQKQRQDLTVRLRLARFLQASLDRKYENEGESARKT